MTPFVMTRFPLACYLLPPIPSTLQYGKEVQLRTMVFNSPGLFS